MAVGNTTLPPSLSHVMQVPCHHGNDLSPTFTPPPDNDLASTMDEGLGGKGKQEEDTDFGAVMYITAVLVFYSLGIVVMIVKYLKTERKEMEEEINLENFFKGIPSKRVEHEREAVNRVAIRAFHTLTSRAAPAQMCPPPRDKATDKFFGVNRGESPEKSDSDADGSDKSDSAPTVLQRERSKYLPRVSLMFRDNRFSDRRNRSQSMRLAREGSPREDILNGTQWNEDVTGCNSNNGLDQSSTRTGVAGPFSQTIGRDKQSAKSFSATTGQNQLNANSFSVTNGQKHGTTNQFSSTGGQGKFEHVDPEPSDYPAFKRSKRSTSCQMEHEDSYRPRRNGGNRKLRNADAPRSSVVSFSDGYHPGGTRVRAENGPTKGRGVKGGSALKNALPKTQSGDGDVNPYSVNGTDAHACKETENSGLGSQNIVAGESASNYDIIRGINDVTCGANNVTDTDITRDRDSTTTVVGDGITDTNSAAVVTNSNNSNNAVDIDNTANNSTISSCDIKPYTGNSVEPDVSINVGNTIVPDSSTTGESTVVPNSTRSPVVKDNSTIVRVDVSDAVPAVHKANGKQPGMPVTLRLLVSDV